MIRLFSILLLLLVNAEGVVIFTPSIGGVFTGGGDNTNSFPIDFNEDGRDDLIFRASSLTFNFVVSGPDGTRLVHRDNGGTRPLAPLSRGTLIDNTFEDNSLTLLDTSEGSGLLSFVFNGGGGDVQGGPFLGQTAYLGFEFQADDGNHFGYVLIQEVGGFGGFFLETGWETEVGKGIRAGAVPEPSSLFLSLLSGILILQRRR